MGTDAPRTWSPSEPDGPAPEREPVADVWSRYEDLGPIGMGGMGEVRRVRDRELHRVVAMKILRPELSSPHAEARFVEEARVAAQLQHPAIVPMYDLGRLPDGRCWFTMKEVRGLTLGDGIDEVHTASRRVGRWTAGPSGLSFRRLIEAFRTICEGVAYAHSLGVLHRDLKPQNAMLGAFGEVQLLDWGLAKVGGGDDAPDEGHVSPIRTSRSTDTRVGSVLGTPSYMAPEQARGEPADHRTDVYALGAILSTILHGCPPGRPSAPGDPPPLDPDLVGACETAMAPDPDRRFQAAGDLANAVSAWLDGSRRREQALEVVAKAEALGPDAATLLARSKELSATATELLATTRPFDPEERKSAGWAAEDAAADLARRAELAVLSASEVLQGALQLSPDLPEAHAALCSSLEAQHREAEADGRARDADLLALRLAGHVGRLPQGHPTRRHTEAWLSGDGRLTLLSDPPGATVELHRYHEENRRLVPRFERVLGPTPVLEVPLAMGSWSCVVRAPGRVPVTYPVRIDRGAHWDGIPPGATTAEPIHLPPADGWDPDDLVVPSGWFWSGGDPKAFYSLPSRRLWVAGFVLRRFPVTHREYLQFLDDLVANGWEDEALRCAPVNAGHPCYGRDGDGRFVLRRDEDGDLWLPDWPVMCVSWSSARTYTAWLAERTGLPWRLPCELEWEKAARGTDARPLPWGVGFDPSRCCAHDSREEGPKIGTIHEFPLDESPYGVRGLAGNTTDWCLDPFRERGPELEGLRVRVPDGSVDEGPLVKRIHRGGHWYSSAHACRAAHRAWLLVSAAQGTVGFRLARSLPEFADPREEPGPSP